ncbi:hypothetical protein [Streptomyces chumphonensis]|uniref:hypothetical protein n=1 Tax=Streptomyces chumphonensis TaxID=1214925 RepID=UPI003D7057A4
MYRTTVQVCLGDHWVKRRLDARPGVTREAVDSAMNTEANTARAMEPCMASYSDHRAAVERVAALRAVRSETVSGLSFDLRTPVGWLFVVAGLVWLAVRYRDLMEIGYFVADKDLTRIGRFLAALVPPLAAAGGLLWWISRQPVAWRNLRNQVKVILYLSLQPPYVLEARHALRTWQRDLRDNGVDPLVHRVIDALLGEDPHAVFLPASYNGLRAAHGHGYVVSNSAAHQLKRKLAILDGGTVAMCGPRGVGKSTLLDTAVKENDFAVRTHVPATYTPHDFLISLCIAICEGYMRRRKYDVPPLTRLSGFIRTMRRLRRLVQRAGTGIALGIPAVGLVALGSWAAARSLWTERSTPLLSRAAEIVHPYLELAREVWRGDNLGAGLLITLAGLAVWRIRKSVRWRRRIGALPRALCYPAALALLIGSPLGLGFDQDVQQHAMQLGEQVGFVVGGSSLFWLSLTVWGVAVYRRVISTAQAHPLEPGLYALATVGCLAGFVALVHSNADATAIVLDDDNPGRLVGVVAGWLLWRLARWRPRPPEPSLVADCRDQLYRLKTVQGTSASLNPSALSPLLTVGSALSSSLSLVPINYPELVDTVRGLLARIADEVFLQGHRTVITIDELDRLGTEAQARAFLNEIKGIFGVPHVFYLVSVAEDVGAAFIRRGLPHRDATDSSLDDIVHVQPCTIAESSAIISRRAPGLMPPGVIATSPYVLLAHALSGGIPRDLIRYGRRIVEVRERTGSIELVVISRQLILEELHDTLAGFRTLLSRHTWTAANADVLDHYRDLMDQLQSFCACNADAARQALERFAADRSPTPSASSGGISGDAAELIHEASAYAYFGLTLLQVFSLPAFDQRSAEAKGRSPAGRPQYLAEARLELSVSPHSARHLIGEVREAWGLSTTPLASPFTVVPTQRLPQCHLHPRP